LLQTGDPLGRLQQLHAERDVLYRESAHLIVDTGNQALRTLVGRLERDLRTLLQADISHGTVSAHSH
jgi:shikimate kinase